MKQRLNLVIIPGLGDDLAIYKTFAHRWERLGYQVHVIPFGWADRSARLGPKMEIFLEKLDALDTPEMYVIGVSAGGTAAINALARRPDVIRKVITVCSPLDMLPDLQNPLLAESIEQTRQLLLHFTPEQKARILSAYALHDPVVNPRLSRPEGIRTMRVAMVVHPAAIFAALMFYARKLDAFFRKAT